jgi:hypothetical protein
MAIPEGRLSTTLVESSLLEPEAEQWLPTVNHERGPLAIEDTTLGLLYQNWIVTYDGPTGEITATPQTTGSPVVLATVMGIYFLTFTFDQSGRITFTYSTSTSSYIYWYDSSIGQTVTTDLGPSTLSPSVYMDDKRESQNASNDMLLWYFKPEEGNRYGLFMRIQRERFLTEHAMATGATSNQISKIGMSAGLRIQIHGRTV